MIVWTQLLAGAVMLYFGAESFVAGASALALALGIPEILIGLTVVAYGTSAPEIIVGIEAASAGFGTVALSNVIGSNIANIGLILGTASLVSPARVDGSLRRRELPMLLVTTALVPILLYDGRVSRYEGAVLMVSAAAYTCWMVRAVRGAVALSTVRHSARVTSAAANVAGAVKPKGAARSALSVLLGLGLLLVGGNVFIGGAVSIAREFGLSERLVGLTIVALGTSLPELVTSVIAARRGHSDLAVGNVIGSNIFNVLLCLAAAALANPLVASAHAFAVDLSALVVMTLAAAVFIRSERTISRMEGAAALALYAMFIAISILHE